MNGVKVSTIVLLDVKMVTSEMMRYNSRNSRTWLVPACFITFVASSLKKPTLSRYTLIALIERNMARVLSGFMSESPKNCSLSCPSGTSPVATSTTAHTNGTTQ